MVDGYSKLIRAMLTAKKSATQAANVFLDNWIFPFGIPSYVIADNDPQFISKFIAAICGYLGIERPTKTPNHPQTNAQINRCKKTTVTRLKNCIAAHQQDWNAFMQPLTYASNTCVRGSTNTFPYRSVHSRLLPGPSLLRAELVRFRPPSLKLHNIKCMSCFWARILALRAKTNTHLRKSKVKYEHNYDCRHWETQAIHTGKYVVLDRLPLSNVFSSHAEALAPNPISSTS